MKIKITCVVTEEREIDLQDKDQLEDYDLEPGCSPEDVIEAVQAQVNDDAENWCAEHLSLITVEDAS